MNLNLNLEPRSRGADLSILIALALVMVATRFNHFAAIPDASWAVFFVGGFYLRRWTKWAFPLLMALAVFIDWAVITSQGIDFWSHYCVSPGYWMLVPAYFSLWFGGMWLAKQEGSIGARLGKLALAVVASVAACQLFAQGGFYWLSDVVADKTVAGWAKNYFDWVGPYLMTTAMYVGGALALHVTAYTLLGQRGQVARN
ncbi:MAG: hypothetical protein IAE66_01415 [Xanthomonadaceae bacterium]|nr:hypothetical protein [Xanthomonadaceae bacterium]